MHVFSRYFPRALTLSLLAFGSNLANAAVTLVVPPSPVTTSTYTVTWSGGRTASYLFQDGVQVLGGTVSGSYTATNMAIGLHNYYVHDCVQVSQSGLSCVDTATQTVTVAAPSGNGGSGGNVGETYEYDALGRLRKVRMDGVVKTAYDYDKAGNRTTVTE